MISKGQVVHKVEVALTVNEVHVQIRFPCKLQISLKIDKDETNTVEEVELKSYLASFSETLKAEVLIAYDPSTKKYLQKKATITVYAVSPRGRNVAGVLPIDLSWVLNRATQEQVFSNEKLQRCPDKEATINLKMKGHLIEELSDSNINLASDHGNTYVQQINSRVITMASQKPNRIESKFQVPRLETEWSERKIDRQLSQNRKSHVEEIRTPISNRLLQSRNEIAPKIMTNSGTTPVNQNFKLKTRIDELQREVDALKKQLNQKKRLQNEVDLLTHKIGELQKVISGNRMQIDTINRQKKRDTTELTSRVEQLEKLNVTLQKRVDVKSSFYKQELQKYNAKLLATQNQKQALILEISTLKDEGFQLNRKINGLKESEKTLNEDKIKLSKRIQQMKKQSNQRQSTTQSNSKDIMHERLKQTISNNELEKLGLIEEIQKLKTQIVNEAIFRTKYEQQLKEKNTVIQQKLYAQNQHALVVEETTSEINRLNKLIVEKTDEIHKLNSRIIQFTGGHKTEVSKMTEEIDTYKSSLELVRQAEEKGRSDFQQVSFALQENQRQLAEATKKCTSLEAALKEAKNQNDQLRKNYKSSTDEGRGLTAEIQKLNTMITDFQNQLTLVTQSKRNNESQHKKAVEKLEAANKQLQKELQSTQDELYVTKMQMTTQQHDFVEQLERKDKFLKEKEHELRNIFQQETDLQMKNAHLQSTEGQLRQSVRILEADLLKQRTLVDNLKRINTTLQQSETQLKSTLNQTKSNLQQKETECETLNESNQALDSMLTSTRSQLQLYKQNVGEHIHTLLKCLVTRNQTEEPMVVQGLSEGLLKLETDVITKVKATYDELEVFTQKLLNKQMQYINLQQSSNLQIHTLQLELSQLKKQLQTAKDESSNLGSNLETTKISLITQNQNLKKQMKEREIQLSQQFSVKMKEATTKFERDMQKMKQEHEKETKRSQDKVRELQIQLANLQKQLYDQYNEVNIMSLKNYQSSETIKELEERLADIENKEGAFSADRNKFISDIMFLEQELNKMSELYEMVKFDHAMALQKETILIEENQYLRSQFQSSPKSATTTISQFQIRERNIVQMHRASTTVQELQAKLNQKESTIKVLSQNIRVLGDEVEEKYKTINELQSEIKSNKGMGIDRSQSRESFSKAQESERVLKSP